MLRAGLLTGSKMLDHPQNLVVFVDVYKRRPSFRTLDILDSPYKPFFFFIQNFEQGRGSRNSKKKTRTSFMNNPFYEEPLSFLTRDYKTTAQLLFFIFKIYIFFVAPTTTTTTTSKFVFASYSVI